MEVPRVITVSIGVDPSPFLDVIAEFDDEDQARHWERDWPALHHRLATHPYVVLTGFSALVARAELSRTDTTVHLRETATDAETLRLLQIVARFIGVEPIASP
jgi:plasmid stabilization system protein ParE